MALASFAYFGGRVQLSAGIPGTSLSPLDNDVLGSVLCEGSTASGTPALEPGIEADTNESDESEGDKDHDNIPGSSQLESDTDGTESVFPVQTLQMTKAQEKGLTEALQALEQAVARRRVVGQNISYAFTTATRQYALIYDTYIAVIVHVQAQWHALGIQMDATFDHQAMARSKVDDREAYVPSELRSLWAQDWRQEEVTAASENQNQQPHESDSLGGDEDDASDSSENSE